MKIACKNRSNYDMTELSPHLESFLPYAQRKMGFNRPPTIYFDSDPQNAEKTLGKTGYYDPDAAEIVIFVDNRHPKDVLRSLSHELVHHTQNCRGDLSPAIAGETGIGYAQNNPHMREMEREAYELGNLCFRDWEDSVKIQLKETNYLHIKGDNHKMATYDKLQEQIRAIVRNKLEEAMNAQKSGEEEIEERKRRDSPRNRAGRREDAQLKPLEEAVPEEEPGAEPEPEPEAVPKEDPEAVAARKGMSEEEGGLEQIKTGAMVTKGKQAAELRAQAKAAQDGDPGISNRDRSFIQQINDFITKFAAGKTKQGSEVELQRYKPVFANFLRKLAAAAGGSLNEFSIRGLEDPLGRAAQLTKLLTDEGVDQNEARRIVDDLLSAATGYTTHAGLGDPDAPLPDELIQRVVKDGEVSKEEISMIAARVLGMAGGSAEEAEPEPVPTLESLDEWYNRGLYERLLNNWTK